MNNIGAGTSVSVVIPVYNSSEILPMLVARLRPVLEACAAPYELILVNDGSADNSWEVICRLAAQHPWIRAFDLMRNYGQHNALLCGIRAARHDVIVTLDDDLQNPPEEIPVLLEQLDEQHDVVYGTPQVEQHGFWRDWASRLTKMALQGAMGAATARQVSAFRAFRRSVCAAFDGYSGPFVSIDILLTWGTTRFDSVRVQHTPRYAGKSNYTFGRLLRHALNMLTGFSTVPLQLASVVGFMFTLVGLLVFVFVVARYVIDGRVVPGFAFLASIIAIFSGIQLLILGIIGEYLARMYYRIMTRPSYAVRSSTDRR